MVLSVRSCSISACGDALTLSSSLRAASLLSTGPTSRERGVVLEELELGGLADDGERLLGVLDAGQGDRDLVAALLLDGRLGDAEAVDAAVEDADRLVELRLGRRLALRRSWPCTRPPGRPAGRDRAASSRSAG